MKSPLIIISLLFIIGTGFNGTDQIVNSKSFNHEAMKKALLLKTNSFRKSKKAKSLNLDNILELAAQDHANFLKGARKLTHEQPKKNKKGVKERIKFHGGNVTAYAENIVEICVQKPCSVYNSKGDSEIKVLHTYNEVAIAMINAWRVSKGHRTNLLSNDYTETGFGVVYNPKTQNVIVVQVFGN